MVDRDPVTGKFVSNGRQLDIYPQWLTLNTAPDAGAGAYGQGAETRTPVVSSEVSSNPLVMEILEFEFQAADDASIQVGARSEDTLYVLRGGVRSNSGTARPNTGDGASLQYHDQEKVIAAMEATETGAAGLIVSNMSRYPQNDGAGHGILFAGKSLFLWTQSTNIGHGAVVFRGRILYRLVQVSIQEYIGMISQFLS